MNDTPPIKVTIRGGKIEVDQVCYTLPRGEDIWWEPPDDYSIRIQFLPWVTPFDRSSYSWESGGLAPRLQVRNDHPKEERMYPYLIILKRKSDGELRVYPETILWPFLTDEMRGSVPQEVLDELGPNPIAIPPRVTVPAGGILEDE